MKPIELLSRFKKTLLTICLVVLAGIGADAQTGFQIIKPFGFPDLSTGSQPYNQIIVGTDGALYGTAIRGGTYNSGVVFRVNTNGTGYQVLHSFGGDPDGQYPQSELLQASDGMLYGTTYRGGTNDDGTIFRVSTNGTGYTVLYNLSTASGRWPLSGLIEGREDGMLYGTGQTGGGNDDFGPGTIFKMNKDGSSFSVIFNFNAQTGGGALTTLLEGSDGFLYSTTFSQTTYNGTIFKISRSGTDVQVLYGFMRNNTDALWITGKLVQPYTNGYIYGVSKDGGNPNPGQFGYNGCGTIFRIAPNGNNYQQLFLLPTSAEDGYTPYGAPFFGADGRIYGTTSVGGANNNGTIYAMNFEGGGFTVLHSFTRAEGRNSEAGLAQAADGTLFGTTVYGGATDNGTVFRIGTNGTGMTVVHNFIPPSGGDATSPNGSLMISNNIAYGTAAGGGAANRGVVFQLDLNTTNYSFLHEFTDGSLDGGTSASVIKATDGCLYGTLPSAGISNAGVVFKLTTNGTYTVLHEFGRYLQFDGSSPMAELVQGRDGFLYGTTQGGGTNYSGTIFKISTNGSGYSVIWQFSGDPDGAYPSCALIQGTDNLLYGTAANGGANGNGTVYRLDTNGNSLQTIYTFQNAPDDANQPSAGLLLGQDGWLYGTARSGGSNYLGAVYKLKMDGSSESVIYSFNGSTDGESPQSALIQTANGKLYGTAPYGGTNSDGVTFSLNTNGTGYTNLRQFAGPDGASPAGALAIGPNGSLYGAVADQAQFGYGAIYRLFNAVTISSIQYQSPNVVLNFAGGISGSNYSILASSNLSGAWLPIGNTNADINGAFQYTDAVGTNHPVRFYRSVGP